MYLRCAPGAEGSEILRVAQNDVSRRTLRFSSCNHAQPKNITQFVLSAFQKTLKIAGSVPVRFVCYKKEKFYGRSIERA